MVRTGLATLSPWPLIANNLVLLIVISKTNETT